MDTRQHDRPRADPHIIANVDRDIELRRLQAQCRIDRVPRCGNDDIWANHHIVSDKDIRIIYQC